MNNTQQQRIEKLQNALEENILITDGTNVVTYDGKIFVGHFIYQHPDAEQYDGIWFCSPQGLPLFEGYAFYKFCQEFARKEVLQQLDDALESGFEVTLLDGTPSTNPILMNSSTGT